MMSFFRRWSKASLKVSVILRLEHLEMYSNEIVRVLGMILSGAFVQSY